MGSKKKATKEEPKIPTGRRISNKVWKKPRAKASTLIKSRGLQKANKFENIRRIAEQRKVNQELNRKIVEERKRKMEERKERRRLNLKKEEENKLKAEVIQVIKNPSKLKKMRKKQLRNIEKRDTLNAQ